MAAATVLLALAFASSATPPPRSTILIGRGAPEGSRLFRALEDVLRKHTDLELVAAGQVPAEELRKIYPNAKYLFTAFAELEESATVIISLQRLDRPEQAATEAQLPPPGDTPFVDADQSLRELLEHVLRGPLERDGHWDPRPLVPPEIAQTAPLSQRTDILSGSGRTYSFWGSTALFATGVALGAYAIAAAGSSEQYTVCLASQADADCGSRGAPFYRLGAESVAFNEAMRGGVPLMPIALGVAGAGLIGAILAIVIEDEALATWVPPLVAALTGGSITTFTLVFENPDPVALNPP